MAARAVNLAKLSAAMEATMNREPRFFGETGSMIKRVYDVSVATAKYATEAGGKVRLSDSDKTLFGNLVGAASIELMSQHPNYTDKPANTYALNTLFTRDRKPLTWESLQTPRDIDLKYPIYFKPELSGTA